MTEQEFLKLITTKSAKAVLNDLSKIPAKDRRAFAKPALKLFKKLDRLWMNAENGSERVVKDAEAVTVAVLATASGSELKKMSFFPKPGKVSLEDVVRKIEPDWLQAVVDHFVEDRVFYVDMFRPLWQAGLCERPENDGIILAYYSHWNQRIGIEEDALLNGDVWRFFEVEGGGEDSLANHDKYLKRDVEGWADRLKRYSEEGKLDRQRLLDASLDALDRDFGQYRAGWYSRFHVLMAPNGEEMKARRDRYLRLLASSIPPTVSFAMKHVQVLDKAKAFEPAALLAGLEPALQARAKGTILSAIKLVQSAAKQQPSLSGQAASKCVLALISEDAGVQGKALDAIEALGVEAVSSDLADYADLVAPSVRPRIAALTGVETAGAPTGDVAFSAPQTRPVLAITSAEEALALFLKVLEDPRDPFEVERAIDGISQFGAALISDSTALSPLRKRAKQLYTTPGEGDLRYVLAITGRFLTEGGDIKAFMAKQSGQGPQFNFVQEHSLQEFNLARNLAVVERISGGVSLPLLALPSDTSGMINAADLISRVALYRAAGVEPESKDLALALMRLAPEGRSAKGVPTDTEADRALAYALGESVPVGPTPELWAAAWRARLPVQADPAIAKLFKAPTPDCGVPAAMELTVEIETSRDGVYNWIDVDVPVTPSNEAKSRALPALFGIKPYHHGDNICCGFTFGDIAWASLTHPHDPEPFFRIALIAQDHWQKLADNPTRAYLEPFFRPGPPLGPLGAGTLAFFMACEDKSVSSLAIEATAALVSEGRLTQERFATALKVFVMSGGLPTSRWTKAMKTIAELGAGTFARDVIVSLLDFKPTDTPRDIGGMLELCYELHVAQGSHFENAKAIACLKTIPGGGKTARFGKKLLELTQQG